MAKRLEANGLWESSRMMLPEHREIGGKAGILRASPCRVKYVQGDVFAHNLPTMRKIFACFSKFSGVVQSGVEKPGIPCASRVFSALVLRKVQYLNNLNPIAFNPAASMFFGRFFIFAHILPTLFG